MFNTYYDKEYKPSKRPLIRVYLRKKNKTCKEKKTRFERRALFFVDAHSKYLSKGKTVVDFVSSGMKVFMLIRIYDSEEIPTISWLNE